MHVQPIPRALLLLVTAALLAASLDPVLAFGDKRNLPLEIESSEAAVKAPDALLSPSSQQLAEQLGIVESLQSVHAIKVAPGSFDPTRSLLARQDLLEAICAAQLEVRSGIARVDAEIALADDIRAQLEERRDKALKLTTWANLVTGTFNGMGGNSLDLAEPTKFAADILDIAQGAVETGLASLALRQQSGEKRLSGPIGGLLARFFDRDGKNVDFPASVAAYLNTVPPGSKSGLTRRAELIERWRKMGIFRRHNESKWEHQVKHITSGSEKRKAITLAVLEDREAMLHDIQACIASMDTCLLEIITCVRRPRSEQ